MTYSINFFNRVSFAYIFSCQPEMLPHAIAGSTYGVEEHRFPHVAYVTTQIYKGIVACIEKERRERKSFCGPMTRPMYYPFFSPAPLPNGERIDKLHGVCRNDEGTAR